MTAPTSIAQAQTRGYVTVTEEMVEKATAWLAEHGSSEEDPTFMVVHAIDGEIDVVKSSASVNSKISLRNWMRNQMRNNGAVYLWRQPIGPPEDINRHGRALSRG